MIHHQDSSWGLTVSVYREGGGRREEEEEEEGKALAGHVDMIPRTLATFKRKKGKLG
jgi:hypothetical protein